MRTLAIGLLVAGCGASTVAPSDAGAAETGRDAASLDAGADAVAVHDASSDAQTTADASAPDDVGLDAGSDAGSDAGRDAGACVPPPTPTTIDALYAAEDGALCEYYDACVRDDSLFGGASCLATTEASWEGELAELDALIAAGRVRFDASAAAACIAAISCTSCGRFFPAVASACFGYLVGTTPEGSPCTADIECETGYCDDPMGCGNSGTCVPRRAVGATCTPGGVTCEPPAFCTSGVCTVTVYASVGDPCPSGSCSGGVLRCWSGTCHDASEASSGGLGAPCTTDGPDGCAIGLVCPSAPSATCQPDDVPVGGACVPSRPDACTPSAYCDGTTCRALPGPGESCASTYRCAAGLGCSCPTDATCALSEYVCVPRHELGEACAAGVDCWSTTCVAGTCAPRPFCD